MADQPAMTAAQMQQQMAAQNRATRDYITRQCPLDIQQIFAATVVAGGAAGGQVVNVLPKNVGLIAGFFVRVDVDVVTPAGVTLARTVFGGANVLSKVEFIDLANLTRISTSGWHLVMVNSARVRRPVGSAFSTDTPLGFGNNSMQGIAIPANIAAATTQRISMTYHVPLAYSRDDLRGAIFANVVNATMALNLTINPQAIAAPGAPDNVLSVYQQTGAGAVLVQNAKVTVYQEFYDQLPMGNGGPSLPVMDLTTAYQLKNTSLVGLSAGQDFPVPFANFSEFLSTSIVFDNGGQLNPGTDVNNFQLVTANASMMWKLEPWLVAYITRNILQTDPPPGMYYFDHRRRPISTLQYGNQQIMVNPSNVNPSAQLLVGWEMMTRQGVVNASGSLPAG